MIGRSSIFCGSLIFEEPPARDYRKARRSELPPQQDVNLLSHTEGRLLELPTTKRSREDNRKVLFSISRARRKIEDPSTP
jgi:hypothetical protein